jgi:hypothetical protein
MDEYPEWTVDQWERAWTIHVGKAYSCQKCGNMIMVIKGGVGVLDPSCCDVPMTPIKEQEISGNSGREYHY